MRLRVSSAERYCGWASIQLNFITAERSFNWKLLRLRVSWAERYYGWASLQLNIIVAERLLSWTLSWLNVFQLSFKQVILHLMATKLGNNLPKLQSHTHISFHHLVLIYWGRKSFPLFYSFLFHFCFHVWRNFSSS